MPNFNIPELPQVLTLKNWQSAKDLPDATKEDSKCLKALDALAGAFKQARMESLAPFFKQTPAWAQYNYARWRKLSDDLVREIIVDGVINLREALGEVRNTLLREEKNINKADPLAPQGAALLRKMVGAAESLLKELRPEVIETAIRDKEQEVSEAMLVMAAAPLEEIKKITARIKTAAAQVMRDPVPATYNKAIGSGAGGLTRELAVPLMLLATLPTTKGMDYEGASEAARMAKDLLSTAPLPATADKTAVDAALKNFLQVATAAAKLPKLKL